jgi:flagellar protein FliO/FliZ
LGGEKLKSSLHIFLLFLVLTAFFSANPLNAQNVEPQEEAQTTTGLDESAFILGDDSGVPSPQSAGSIFIVLRMVMVLALAALAIYGVVFFIKRLARPQDNPNPHLRILARVPIGNDSFAAVLSVGTKAWLVGGGSGGLNLISEIDDQESLETMLLEDSAKVAVKPFFSFLSLLKRQEPGEKTSFFGFSHAQTLRKQRDRLGGL